MPISTGMRGRKNERSICYPDALRWFARNLGTHCSIIPRRDEPFGEEIDLYYQTEDIYQSLHFSVGNMDTLTRNGRTRWDEVGVWGDVAIRTKTEAGSSDTQWYRFLRGIGHLYSYLWHHDDSEIIECGVIISLDMFRHYHRVLGEDKIVRAHYVSKKGGEFNSILPWHLPLAYHMPPLIVAADYEPPSINLEKFGIEPPEEITDSQNKCRGLLDGL